MDGKEEQIWCLEKGILTNKKGSWKSTDTDKWSLPDNGKSARVKRTTVSGSTVLEVGTSDTKVTYEVEAKQPNATQHSRQQWLRQDIGCFTLRNEKIILGRFEYLTAVSENELKVETLR